MNELLNVSNPKKKIDDVIKKAISSKEEQVGNLKEEIDTLNGQLKNETYYVKPVSQDEMSVKELSLNIIYILKSIFDGFSRASERLQTQANQDIIQRGGETNKLKQVANTANQLKQVANTAKQLNQVANTAKQLNQVANIAGNKTDELIKKVQSGEILNNVKEKVTTQLKNSSDNLKNNNSLVNVDGNSVTPNIYDLGYTTILHTGVKLSEKFINYMINTGLTLSGNNDLLDTPIDQLSPELNKKILLLGGVLKEMSENPATREAIKEIAEAIAITLLEILQDIKPSLDKITDQSLEMLNEIASKSVRGFTETGVSVLQSFIAEVPFWGGIIDLIISFGKGFNTTMETYKIVVDQGGPIAIDAVKSGVKTKNSLIKGKERVTTAIDNATKTITAASTIPPRQYGGKYIGCKKTKKGIKMGGKRLRKTMKLFQSTLPKLKFISSLH